MPSAFYPPLSSLVPRDSFPEALGFVRDGLTNLLSDLYFKDLQHSTSPRGDAAQYSLSIVTPKPLEVEVPGTGIFLVLNPGHTPGSTSEFPVALRYEWGILTWLREFDLTSFSFQPGDFFQLALTVLGLTERQLIDRALSILIGGATPINQFVTDVNAFYGTALPQPVTADPIGEVLAAIEAEPALEDSSVLIFSVYILDNLDLDKTAVRVEEFFAGLFGGSLKDYFLKLITPKIEATLRIGAGVRFPRNVLVPLDAIGGSPLPEPAQSMLTFDAGAFFFSTERGIGYDQTLAAALVPSQIGNTGFEIAVTGARLDVSRTTNIPEATADGRSEDFVGVFVEQATIKLPPFFNQDAAGSSAQLIGRNLLIGTGGLSGTIALEAVDPNSTAPALLKGRFGSGFELGLSAVRVAFQQNAITQSEILGFMKVPGFKDTEGNPAEVQIAANIGTDGEFSVTASEEQGIRALRIPDILDLIVTSLALGRKEGRFFVSVSGAIDFVEQAALGKFVPDKIEIQKLVIWDDGQIELEGGGLVLPQPATLKLGPVDITITAIHFGSLEQEHDGQLRKYAFFGFDGGVSIDPGGVDARGDGIKFYFTTDTGPGKPLHFFLRIQSLAIDLIIPGDAKPEEAALLLKGFLSMKEDGAGGTEYIGGVAFSLPRLAMSGSAAMRYNPRLPSFLIDAGLELAAPIVLGATGLGIYGFRGLVGMRYVAKKSAAGLTDDAQWWQYYKAKVAPDMREGIQVSKFAAEEGFSLGAGVTLATVSDAGRAFSSKLFFLLSLPEVFLLQGQGQILKERIGLDTTKDPPFFAMIAITSTSIEAAFGVDYNVPDEGDNVGAIAQIDGLLEMGFFWGDAGAWYINVGKDEPEDRRVRARLLTIFNSYYYLMLSSSGIRTGAGVSYELKKKIGPFRVELGAYLDLVGRLSFKPLQIGGSIELGGHLELSIFGCGFGLSASASLAAEAPRPFVVTGRLKACVKILWSKKCVTIELTWVFDDGLNYDEVELFGANLAEAIQAVNIQTLESYTLFAARTSTLPSLAQLADHVVPMDSFIDIEFRQGLNPSGAHPSLAKFEKLGGAPEFTVLVPPQRADSSQVQHAFALESVEIFSWNPATSAWQPYDIFAAATPLQLAPFVTTDLSTLPFGYWQKNHPTIHKQLRILALSPFSYLRPETPGQPPLEDLGVLVEDVFCAPEERERHCRDFSGALAPGEHEKAVPAGVWRSMPDVLYRVGPGAGAIRREPWKKFQNALCVDESTTIRLLLPEPTVWAEVLLRTEGQAVEVTWYARVPIKNPNGHAPLHTWQVVKANTVLAAELDQPVTYDDPARPVLRIDVRGVGCGSKPIKPETVTAGAELLALGRFLDALAQNRQLAGPTVALYPELLPAGCLGGMFGGRGRPKPIEEHTYYPTFLNSPLYTWAPGTQWVRYEVASATPTALRFVVTDSAGLTRSLELHPADKQAIADWSGVRNVRNVTPAPAGEEFTAEAVLDGGAVRQLSGRSSFLPQATALGNKDEKPPIHCSPELTEQAPALLKFLDRLVGNGHLLEKDLLLHPKNHDLYEESFLRSPLYDLKQTRAQQVLYRAAWDKELAPLVIRIRDFLEYDCVIRLAPFKDGTPVRFDEIVGFLEIRRDPDATGPGAVYDFLVLVRFKDGHEAWLRGRSCYPIGECHVGCRTCLYRVCYETVEDAQHNDSIPTAEEVEEAAEEMVAGLSGSIQPIWRPDTHFAVRLVTRDVATRYDDAQEGGNYPRTYVVGWRTTGPLGHFHKYPGPGGATQTLPAFAALDAAGRADEFKTANLQHYLDFPRCYPNADGRLTAAKPLFYVLPRLDLFYLRPYVYEMYRDWDTYNGAEKVWSSLRVAIIDPAPPPGAPVPAPVEGDWQETVPTSTTPEVVVIDDMLTNGEPCADVPPPKPIDVYTTFPIPQLEPLKLYTAVFSNVFRRDSAAQPSVREVHRYVFQTSRYASFAAQVQSWVLKAEGAVVIRAAVYEVEVDADAATLAAAAAVLADPATSSDDLKQRFADPFDRLTSGILKLGALPPAATTEFNVIRLRGTGRVLGILVRNPEPFNDPKVPAADLEQTLTLSVAGGPASTYRGLHARDAASAFVTNADESLNVPAGTHRFTFRYLRWDGTAYVNEATETAEFDRS